MNHLTLMSSSVHYTGGQGSVQAEIVFQKRKLMDSYFLFLQVWRADRLLVRHVKLSKNVLFVKINKTEPQSVKRVVWLWQTASEFDSILSKKFGAVGTPESQSVIQSVSQSLVYCLSLKIGHWFFFKSIASLLQYLVTYMVLFLLKDEENLQWNVRY